MRLLLLVVCLVLTACASSSKSDGYMRTTGTGYTYEEAKNNAFREAIEYQLGVVIASERETYNEKTKDEILAYSAGFVDEYKIISQHTINGRVQLVVDVKISLLKLSNRILSKGKDSKNFDGAKHGTQYKSFLENKENGDRILNRILRDYPHRAYTVKQSDYVVKVDAYRNLTLVVPYELQWSGHYLDSLGDAMKLLQDGTGSWMNKSPYNVRVVSDRYYFNDITVTNKIMDAMMDWNEVRIKLDVVDFNRNTLYSECFKPKSLHRNVHPLYNIEYVGTQSIGLNKSTVETNNIEIKIHQSSQLAKAMQSLKSIDLIVVPKKVCTNNM
jgi:hypothetical protein